jgi:hypothetical protein
MPDYQIYFLREDGRIAENAAMAQCRDDEDVIRRAGLLSFTHGLEIREGDRLVVRLSRTAPAGS